MNNTTIKRLIELNHQFYQTFAVQFSATRQRLQPGVMRIMDQFLPALERPTQILDIGCGNGELTRVLAERNHPGFYTGLDFSQDLLEVAQASLPQRFPARFFQANLAAEDWDAPIQGQRFTAVMAFAVLHHLPGGEIRLRLVQKACEYLAPGGRFFLSVWQFLNSPRLRQRIQPWETIGMSPEQVEPGDFLLDWRSGGYGLRYVHHFTEEELLHLANQTGCKAVDTFYSDGQGGQLGLYQVWEREV